LAAAQFYPRENVALQKEIAANHLLISQVPVKRYEQQANPVANRHFFLARNITMSALTDATVIVEAGETSGTLVQARAALNQNRKLFILDSCFRGLSPGTSIGDFERTSVLRATR
jgi:DNA processing protein